MKNNKLILIITFYIAFLSGNVLYAESLDDSYQGTNIFTSPGQRRQLNALRRKLELGIIVDDIPTKVEAVKKEEVILLPKITFKGYLKKQGIKPIFWIENNNNLQGSYQFENKISVIGINKKHIEIDYQDVKGIKLEPNQTYVPSENKTYEGFEEISTVFDEPKKEPVEEEIVSNSLIKKAKAINELKAN